MDANKVDAFLTEKGKMFAQENLEEVRTALLAAGEEKLAVVEALSYKDPILVLILSIVVGAYGVDRFMLGDTKMGVVKLLTCGGCWIMWLLDIFKAQPKAKEFNLNLLKAAL